MRKILIVVWILFGVSYGKAQVNLVPNPSFEVYDTCPSNASQISKAIGWFKPSRGSPDYYNRCDSVVALHIVGVPLNYIGYQQAHTGVAYSGIMNYDTYHWGMWDTIYEYREYIEAKLNDTLQAGKNYKVNLYVSLGDSARWATDGMGIFFSQDSLLNDTGWYNFQVTPQIVSSTGIPIIDKINWVLISGEYTALGGEQFITIGNFFNNANTDTTFLTGGNIHNSDYTSAYYYIDDVSIVLDTLNTVSNKNSSEKIQIYPNPVCDYFTIKKIDHIPMKVDIYNSYGQLVHSVVFNENSFTIDMLSWQEGLYNLFLKTNKESYTKKIIKINK